MDRLRPFFKRYGAAFETYDADAVAAYYVLPCLFVRDGATVAVATREGVVESVEALLEVHRGWDVQIARPAAVALLEQGPGHALARVDWRLGRKESRLAWSFSTTYALVPGADDWEQDWQIAAAVTHDSPF